MFAIKIFARFLPFFIAITTLSLLVYAASQQVLRQSANDPQIQMAEDVANELSAGHIPSSVVSPPKDSLGESLSPFLIIFNNDVKPIAASVYLNEKTPLPPSGVFEYAKMHDENRLTWQPRKDVRIAAVVRRYNSGYVLAGRSLREVEKREDSILKLAVITWLFTNGAILLVIMASKIFLPHKNK